MFIYRTLNLGGMGFAAELGELSEDQFNEAYAEAEEDGWAVNYNVSTGEITLDLEECLYLKIRVAVSKGVFAVEYAMQDAAAEDLRGPMQKAMNSTKTVQRQK